MTHLILPGGRRTTCGFRDRTIIGLGMLQENKEQKRGPMTTNTSTSKIGFNCLAYWHVRSEEINLSQQEMYPWPKPLAQGQAKNEGLGRASPCSRLACLLCPWWCSPASLCLPNQPAPWRSPCSCWWPHVGRSRWPPRSHPTARWGRCLLGAGWPGLAWRISLPRTKGFIPILEGTWFLLLLLLKNCDCVVSLR